MTITTFVLIFVALLAASLACHWLDSKYQWRLHDWLNGLCAHPFQTQSIINAKDSDIDVLQKRVETLEAIVTEPAYELKQKINQL